MYLHWCLCGDKCKYIDVRNIINLQVHPLFLAAGLLEDKTRENRRAQSMFTFFSNPLLCLQQDDFKITQRDEREDTKIILKLQNRFLV